MHRNWPIALAILTLLAAGIAAGPGDKHPAEGPAVLWRDPADLASRDLYYGPGGKAHEPRGPFRFEKENTGGSNPKFDVIDRDGVRWTVKLGEEARPETAATRLVWAAGYFATEDYFVPVLHVEQMQRLHRGNSKVARDGTVHDVRLKRHSPDQKKIGSWSWENAPFAHSREWYGLQVLMAVINNWDLKDDNNSIFQVRGESVEQRYLVSDLGSSFGSTGLTSSSKGGLKAYERSRWIGKTSPDSIDFNVPSAPSLPIFFNVPEFALRRSLLWIGRKVPAADARWIGTLLGRLSPDQIRQAFRAAGYSPAEVEGYSQIVERRIAELQKL